jgi:hypothetical protein
MMAERAVVVAEAERLTALGKRRSADEHTRLVALQAKLAEFAPRVKAFKAIRKAIRQVSGAGYSNPALSQNRT